MSSASVKIRPYRTDDYPETVRIWQAGFHELSNFLYRDITSTKAIGSMLAIAATAALFKRFTLASVIATSTVLLLTPLGKKFAGSLMWLGILAETRRDMSPEALKERWQKPGYSAFWVAEVDGKVVGCVGVKGDHTLLKERRYKPSSKSVKEMREASVWRLSVDQNARRLGVARKLMAQLEQWAAEHKYQNISLICGNPDSKRFYASIGYAPLPFSDVVAAVWGPGKSVADVQREGTLFDRWKLKALEHRVVRRGNILGKQVPTK